MNVHYLSGEASLRKLSELFRCNNVLCLVNSISEQEKAVGVAKSLAACSSGICKVVMCLDAPRLTSRGDKGLGKHAPLTPEVIGKTEHKLSELYGKDVSSMVLPGHPVTEIRRYARNNGVDLIVIGEQGMALERKYNERICDDVPCVVMMLSFPTLKENSSEMGPSTTKGRMEHER